MSNTVTAWHSEITHITDEEDGSELRTRCGRTLKRFHLGLSHDKDCLKCGSSDDFKVIREQLRVVHLEEQQQREEAKQAQKERQAARLANHRLAMGKLETMLLEMGVEDIDHRQQLAGGIIEFKIDGLKFKLLGDIW